MTAITWTNEKRKLRDLIPWDINPATIDAASAKRLDQSLEEFGQVETLAISPDNEIYDGHQRQTVWSASAKYGPDYEVDVRVSSRKLTERERKKLVIFLRKGAVGQFDFDMLANNWETSDLLEWGFKPGELQLTPDASEWGAAMAGLPDEDRAPFQQMTFTLHDTQAETVKEALAASKGLGAFVDSENENSNGNALARICEMFLEANDLVKRVHYSGKIVQNSQLHIGVFYRGKLEGAMQFGPSLDKRKIQGLVSGSLWHEFIELNRMAFSDNLPRNSESRALSIAMKLLRKFAPQIKWVVTFADGTQCGDGTIYRAAGFILTGIKENNQIVEFPDGYRETRAELTGTSWATIRKVAQRYGADITGGASLKPFIDVGAKPVSGFMLRYIYFIDPSYRARLTVPELPYSEIERRGAGMYKGQPRGRSADSGTVDDQSTGGGATPTRPLLEL